MHGLHNWCVCTFTYMCIMHMSILREYRTVRSSTGEQLEGVIQEWMDQSYGACKRNFCMISLSVYWWIVTISYFLLIILIVWVYVCMIPTQRSLVPNWKWVILNCSKQPTWVMFTYARSTVITVGPRAQSGRRTTWVYKRVWGEGGAWRQQVWL